MRLAGPRRCLPAISHEGQAECAIEVFLLVRFLRGIVFCFLGGLRSFPFPLKAFFRQTSTASGVPDQVLVLPFVQQRRAVQAAAKTFCQG
jgi:hypothetical protein